MYPSFEHVTVKSALVSFSAPLIVSPVPPFSEQLYVITYLSGTTTVNVLLTLFTPSVTAATKVPDSAYFTVTVCVVTLTIVSSFFLYVHVYDESEQSTG